MSDYDVRHDAWRDAHGAFTTVDQLAEVDGIGAARLARLREHVRV